MHLGVVVSYSEDLAECVAEALLARTDEPGIFFDLRPDPIANIAAVEGLDHHGDQDLQRLDAA